MHYDAILSLTTVLLNKHSVKCNRYVYMVKIKQKKISQSLQLDKPKREMSGIEETKPLDFIYLKH